MFKTYGGTDILLPAVIMSLLEIIKLVKYILRYIRNKILVKFWMTRIVPNILSEQVFSRSRTDYSQLPTLPGFTNLISAVFAKFLSVKFECWSED